MVQLVFEPTTYSSQILPRLAAEARNEIKEALTDQFTSMPPDLSPASLKQNIIVIKEICSS